MEQKVRIDGDWLITNENTATHLADIIQVHWYNEVEYNRQKNPNVWDYIKILTRYEHASDRINYSKTETSLLRADMKVIREAVQRVRRQHVGRVGKGSW